ncbi:MAG: hypothetical protein AB7T20_01875 [Steroidobacteraceae bacterium]
MAAMRRALASSIALLATVLLPATPVQAGGPLLVRANGTPYTWITTSPISYRTDNGPLSATVGEAAARTRVQAMFSVWQNVASSSISYSRAGFINDVGAFTDGDVSTGAEYDAVEGGCVSATQSAIIYDADGTIFTDLGYDVTSILGFAGPCALDAANYVAGNAVMNGLFVDGQPTPVQDIPADAFDAVFVHEFGHFSGLDHSQINVNCQFGCSNDDLAGLPTMFPLLLHVSQGQLSIDDIAWISMLYPQAGAGGFAATHGTISGTVFFSDGESHAQLVNVIARQVDTGLNQDRTTAASNVSGYRFRFFHGNPINDPGDTFGGTAPNLIGLYEIPVPPGNYMIEVESIDPGFTESSSVGGPVWIPMPGAAPAPIGPINVTAGSTVSGNNLVLIGSPPRFDQFEGP